MSGDASRRGHFVITEHSDHLLIEAIGQFCVASMTESTVAAARIIRQPDRRWNIITDFSRGRVAERDVKDVLSAYSRENRPFVRKSAVLGLSGVKRFFFDVVVRLSGRKDLRLFKTRDEALAWFNAPLPRS